MKILSVLFNFLMNAPKWPDMLKVSLAIFGQGLEY